MPAARCLARSRTRSGSRGRCRARLGVIKQRRRGHDPGRVISDLAVMLADGGECVADLGRSASRTRCSGRWRLTRPRFGRSRRIAQTPGDARRAPLARTRTRASGSGSLRVRPSRLTIDVDATLITAHSEKENAPATTSTAMGFTRSARTPIRPAKRSRCMLRPGNAGSNTAADHVTVIDRALAQIPDDARRDHRHPDPGRFGRATHQTADHCHGADLRFSFGYELTEPVRAAILTTPEDAWIAALDQDGSANAPTDRSSSSPTASTQHPGRRVRG